MKPLLPSSRARTFLPSLALLLLGLMGAASAGIWKKAPSELPPASAPTEPAPTPETASPSPALPPPPLFPKALPVIVDLLPAGLANLSATQCGACHFDIHSEWKRGTHAASARSEAHQRAAKDLGNPMACRSCHLPILNQHARIGTFLPDGDLSREESQPNPSWSATLQAEGVTCAACHVREGWVLGPSGHAAAPHPLRATDELGKPEFCATCHQLTWPGATEPFYDTYGEWSRSAWGTAGARCQDCHMIATSGVPTGGRFAAHADHGVRAPVERALGILVTLASPEIHRGSPFPVGIRIQNTGAGHSVPTGSPSRSMEIRATLRRADGKIVGKPISFPLARRIEATPPFSTLEDTRLGAGEERQMETVISLKSNDPAGPAFLEVSLYRAAGAEPLVRQVLPVTIL